MRQIGRELGIACPVGLVGRLQQQTSVDLSSGIAQPRGHSQRVARLQAIAADGLCETPTQLVQPRRGRAAAGHLPVERMREADQALSASVDRNQTGILQRLQRLRGDHLPGDRGGKRLTDVEQRQRQPRPVPNPVQAMGHELGQRGAGRLATTQPPQVRVAGQRAGTDRLGNQLAQVQSVTRTGGVRPALRNPLHRPAELRLQQRGGLVLAEH